MRYSAGVGDPGYIKADAIRSVRVWPGSVSPGIGADVMRYSAGVGDPGYTKTWLTLDWIRQIFSIMSRHGHLRRLQLVWDTQPLYFVTTCVAGRRPLLANHECHAILRDEWGGLFERHGWAVGRYVVMPDHVHFFLRPEFDGGKPLSNAVARWKEWTTKRMSRISAHGTSLWQPEFFDHILRSSESASEKWNYVRENPVRAGLVVRPEDWPYAGAIHFE